MGLSDLRQLADTEENGLRQNSEYRWCEIREQRIQRYTIGHLKEILGNAVRGGRLKLDDLSQGLRKKVEKHLLTTG